MTGSRMRLTVAGGVLILLAMAALSWFLVLSPRLSVASKANAQADQLATANLSLRNQYNQGRSLAEEASTAAADAQQLFDTMPEQAELPLVIEQLIDAATAAGIRSQDIDVINTSVPVAVAVGAAPTTGAGVNLAQMGVDITARGTRRELLDFVDNLQSLDRALLVRSTQFLAAPTVAVEGPLQGDTLQVTGTMFVLQSRLPDLVANVEQLVAESGQLPEEQP